MKIGFVGCGKLGLMVALSIESRGHDVKGYDLNPDIKEYLQNRSIPFKEEHSEELLKNSQMEMTSLEDLCSWADILFLAPQTPHEKKYEGDVPLPDSRADFNYTYLVKCIKQVNKALVKPTVCVLISTVLPGTIEREVTPHLGEHFKFVYEPLFIAMGTVYEDFLHPEFVLVGVQDPSAAMILREFYSTIHNKPIFLTDVKTAEGIKVFYNCFTGDTNVSLLNGKEEAIKNLVGKGEQWFYGCDAGKIIPVKGQAVTGQKNQQMVSVTLDNGEIVTCTKSHLWQMRDASYKRACDLKPNDSLMPLYRKLTKKDESKLIGQGYELYQDNIDGMWKVTHRMFSNIPSLSYIEGTLTSCEKTKKHTIRHHVDFNRRNNTPENLAWMTWEEHNKYHRELFAETSRNNWATMREFIITRMKEGQAAYFADEARSKKGRIARSKNQTQVWKMLWLDPEWIKNLHSEEVNEKRSISCSASWNEEKKEEQKKRLSTLYTNPDSAINQYQKKRKEKAKNRGAVVKILSDKVSEFKCCCGCNKLFVAYNSSDRKFYSKACFTKERKREQVAYNHKVVSVKEAQNADTYCIMILHPCHNFALSAGVFVHNTFITTKTVLANLYGELAHRLNMNVNDIFAALSLSTDRLLSPKYLQAGMGDGGGCHPRDNIALSWVAREHGMSFDFFSALMTAREKHVDWLADLVIKLKGNLPVFVIGRSFKPETNIETGSPSVLLCHILTAKGVKITSGDDLRPTVKGLYFIGTKHKRFISCKFPAGSIIIDPFRYIPSKNDIHVIALGDGNSLAEVREASKAC